MATKKKSNAKKSSPNKSQDKVRVTKPERVNDGPVDALRGNPVRAINEKMASDRVASAEKKVRSNEVGEIGKRDRSIVEGPDRDFGTLQDALDAGKLDPNLPREKNPFQNRGEKPVSERTNDQTRLNPAAEREKGDAEPGDVGTPVAMDPAQQPQPQTAEVVATGELPITTEGNDPGFVEAPKEKKQD